MNIDQFISKLETSDAYRNNGEVKKLVDQSRQVLIDLAHGNDGDAFKAELMKFNDRLDECLNPKAVATISPEASKLIEKLKLRKQYAENLLILEDFGYPFDPEEKNEDEAPVPSYGQVIGSFTPEQLELASTFLKPTLLLVPENSFQSKIDALDVNLMEGQIETQASADFFKTDSSSSRIVGWRATIVNGEPDWEYNWGYEADQHFGTEVELWKKNREPGIKSIDRNAYAMLMMKGLQNGQPIDQYGCTLLADDPVLSKSHVPTAQWLPIGGGFPGSRVSFFKKSAHDFDPSAHIRFSVGGDVVLNKVGEKKSIEKENPLLAILKARFELHPDWHEGVEWADVEQSLKANPEKLVSLQKMEDTGGEPDLLWMAYNDYYFGDSSEETPRGRVNMAYSREAQMALPKGEHCKGNVEDSALEMGVDVMDEIEYELLQGLKAVDKHGQRSWLKTFHTDLGDGQALVGKLGVKIEIEKRDPRFHRDFLGWRGVLRVPMAKEESPQVKLLQTLKARFMKSHPWAYWSEVEKSLLAHPEKLAILQKMEDTGGEPELLDIEGDQFIFADCSDESPSGRRNFNYHQSAEQARDMGVEMMKEAQYRLLQERKPVDQDSWSWLETPQKILDTGFALRGDRGDEGVNVVERDADFRYPFEGWRGMLKVPKV